MKPNRVPDDLIEAAGNAIRAWYAAHSGPNSYLDDRTRMRLVLAAALTLHNERVEQPLRERAEIAERELAELRERIGKSETPNSHCPWCGMAMWLNADGLVPLHGHPVNGGRCPGIGRRPSDEWRDGEWKAAEDPSWTDHGDGWKSRRPTLSDLQGPFTGLLGPFGTNGGEQA